MPAKTRSSSPKRLEDVTTGTEEVKEEGTTDSPVEDEGPEGSEETEERDNPVDPVVEDYDNRPDTTLYTLEDVQAWQREDRQARAEGREATLTDPRLRTHDADTLEEVAPYVHTYGGGVSINAGVSNPEELVKGVPDGTQLPHPEAYTEPEPEVVDDEDELIDRVTTEDKDEDEEEKK